jgi:hypothetical protein
MVLERSQFLDANRETAKIMTVLASLLAESGALKRADTLLRQALELFWREFKDPTPTVARCYRVRGGSANLVGRSCWPNVWLRWVTVCFQRPNGSGSW